MPIQHFNTRMNPLYKIFKTSPRGSMSVVKRQDNNTQQWCENNIFYNEMKSLHYLIFLKRETLFNQEILTEVNNCFNVCLYHSWTFKIIFHFNSKDLNTCFNEV